MKKIKKILLVDDDMDIITPIKLILESQNYEVITANNKKEGFAKTITEKPDLAILDVMMDTQFEGFELAREIKTDPKTRMTKVIMHTSINVFTTTKGLIQEMSHEIRKNPNNRDLRVVLIKNMITGEAGIDYFNDDKKNIFINIDEFIPKPMDLKKINIVIKKMEAKW